MALTLFVENLTVLDCSLLSADQGIQGESWRVDIELDGELDQQSMLLDFGEVKKQIKRHIDETLDHTLLLPGRLPGLLIEKEAEQTRVVFDHCRFGFESSGPAQAYSLLDCEAITAESVALHLQQLIQPLLPDNLQQVRFTLVNEQVDGVMYQYSHGLKKHGGNCQRIVHGHRSTIRIFRNGERDRQAESAWATRWQNIYLGTAEDVTGHTEHQIDFAYSSNQGHFTLRMPAARCEILDRDTTVEELARYITEQLHDQHPDAEWRVQAFEGIGKGAIYRIPPRR
ncbi:hypothetical protein WH50_20500 [Pokkaliibacter plantistimulans]|uniref:6-carboxy-5,6,7,8-tetrahydropterin synthase n=1 Tax=Pokkaliibacter plantistimulans TaxID=1635171 RepID=A0ABX5LTJ0_9GAMM|nr:6-carboxytetrahydropterin synthase [Pokkaliibacter plantistimulans]PXF29522.1 hypothetical protein WH50_20500 [Pokkaliibacter plantistimulans]